MTSVLDSLADDLHACHDDPDLFNELFLSPDDSPTPFWHRQVEMSESVVKYRTTVIYSGNAIGKDFWVGRLIWWWLLTRPNSLVIVTGPSQTTIGTITWKEVRRAAANAPIPFGIRISEGAKNSPQQIDLGAGWQALGFSTTNTERSSGQHAEYLLVIVEEASAVEEHAWDAIESLKYDRLVVIGNPLRAEGTFVDLIRQAERDRNDGILPNLAVNAIQIPSTDSPHAGQDKSPFGLADKTWIDSVARRYGVGSLWYKSHVLAEIPAVSSDILIPIQWLDFAYSQPRKPHDPNHPINLTRVLACDLGEGVGRDSSCLLVRDDWGVRECVWGSQLGLPEAAALMAKLVQKWSIPVHRISFDKLGIGKNFPNQLAKHGLQNARPYVGSGSPRDKTFSNLRTEAAWRLRERLDVEHVRDIRSPHLAQDGFSFVPGTYQERLRAELEPLTYRLDGRHTKLLGKDEWADILGHSPDVADTLIQSFSGVYG